MKKRFILTTLLLAALFALCMSAYAADPAVYVGGVGMEDGDYLANGATTTSTTQPSGGYAYYKNDTLTLNGYDNGGEAYKYYTNYYGYYGNSYTAIYSKLASLKIVLEGENTLTNESGGYGISSDGSDVEISGTGSLKINDVTHGIFAHNGNITINGGTFEINPDYEGIRANGVTISGGTVEINSMYGDGIYASGVAAISGGTIDITADGHGIYANASGVTISGGEITIYADGDGINAFFGDVAISGGTIDITAGADGIYVRDVANKVTISGGIVDITATGYSISGGGDVTVGTGMTILLPKNGTVNNLTATRVLIAPDALVDAHSGHTNPYYAWNSTHHWQYCGTADCVYNRAPELLGAPVAHDTTGTGGTCVCGYNPDKSVGVYVGGVGMADGEYLDCNGALSTTEPAFGGYAHLSGSEDGKTLTLNGYDNDGAVRAGDDAAAIKSSVELTIELVGKNKLSSSKHGIYADNNLAITGDGSLEIDANNLGIRAEPLTIRGGKIDINSGNWGIFSEDYGVTIEDSDVTINSDNDGIYAYGGGNVTVSGGALLAITSGGKGISVGYGRVDGDVIISGATVDITTGGNSYDGIRVYRGGGVTISDSTVNITATGNGIYADGAVTISGGYGTIVGEIQALKIGAADDGVLTIGDRMEVLGSTDENGSGAKSYVESKRSSYKYIWFAPATSSPADPDDPTTPADPTVPTITNPVPENATVSDDGTVTVPAEGGSVSYPATFGAGETVTVTVTPDEYEKIASVVINGVQYDNSGVYVIENVTEALDIRVIFVKAQSFIDAAQGQEPSEPEVPAYAGSALRFYDVMPYNSAYDAINFVADRGIMNGTGVGQFSPEAALTRSMMATILWRMEGEPTVWYGGQFSDVKGGQWYSTPIAWANAAGIVEGYGNGVFGLNDSLTHGQLCAMLYRWNTRSYGDIDTAWAWAQANGLYDDLAGVSADEAATRAGIAEVLMAFVTRVW